MTNGLLINYAGVPHEISSLFPDNGLASLAAVMKANNHNVRIFDYSVTETIRKVYNKEIRDSLSEIVQSVFGNKMLDDREIAYLLELESEIKKSETDFLDEEIRFLKKYIRENNVSWAGFKLWMTGTQQSMYMASELKKCFPNLKIFAGGPSVDIFQKAILKNYPALDVIAFSEAEEILPLLAEWVKERKDLSKIPGIIYKDDNHIVSNPVKRIENPDALPAPVYDDDIYEAMSGHQKMKIICFDESRGCPMGCAFCPDPNKYKKRRIEKSAERCVDILSYLKEKYGVSYFRFSGSNTSASLMSEIADLLISKNLSVTFSVFSSAIGLTPELVKKLARAGLFGIFTGVESADHKQLKEYLAKPCSPDKFKTVIESCKEHDIFVSISMIYPAPFSDDDVFKKNISYLTSCLKGYPASSVQIFPAGLYPFTKWFGNLEKYGFSLLCPSKDDYINIALNYHYNIILPRYLWKDLPYALNGKTFKELLFETNRMALELRKHGILPYFIEANLMMAKPLGYENYSEFAKDSNVAFFTGNSELLEEWNTKFNTYQGG